LSVAALSGAARNLLNLGCTVELNQGDLLEGLRASDETFDLIFCSFALHHLVPADKETFFQSAYRALNEHGMLLLIDAMRDEDEDIQLYLDRYCDWLRSEWKALSSESLDLLCEHIGNNRVAQTTTEYEVM